MSPIDSEYVENLVRRETITRAIAEEIAKQAALEEVGDGVYLLLADGGNITLNIRDIACAVISLSLCEAK